MKSLYFHLFREASLLERYSRQLRLSEIGEEGQGKLLKARVLVVGAGGLGCPVLQYLAAAGVGKIGIIDFDVVEESNLHRQVLFGVSDLGRQKALVAQEKLLENNPTIVIEAYPEKLTAKNVVPLFKEYDLVVDATDNFESRYLINDASRVLGQPFVFGGIYKFEGQLSVFNYRDGPSYRCLFPNPPQKTVLSCDEIGVLGVLPGIIGLMQANEVLKIILEMGDVFSGKLCCYNALEGRIRMLEVKKRPEEIAKVLARGQRFECYKEISVDDVWNKKDMQLIDVRELDEIPVIIHKKVKRIPLSDFENQLPKISLGKKIIFFCQTGKRSRQAVDQLKSFEQFKECDCAVLNEGAITLFEELKINQKK